MGSCLDGFCGVHCRGGALLLPKSVVASQSSMGAVELRPYKPTYKVRATTPYFPTLKGSWTRILLRAQLPFRVFYFFFSRNKPSLLQ